MYPVTLNPLALRQSATAVEAAFDCTTELFVGFQRSVELNVQTAKTSISEQAALTDAALSVRTPSELIDLHTQQLSAAGKKTFAYCRHVETIAAETASRFFTAMSVHSEDFLKRLEEMTNFASGGFAAQVNRTSLLITGEPAVAEPVAIVDSAGEVLSSGDGPSDLH
ncbi:phasin family protein [Paraburkholderia sediminicola]|uniref:phasin family protein n=1 Tax=Paraburkholderia sediminicola TaxID=458836 RepID=UPI000E741D55